MADSDNKYYAKRIKEWIKKPFWIHREANMDNIKSVIEYENNKAISSKMNSKTDVSKLISDVDKLPSVKQEMEKKK